MNELEPCNGPYDWREAIRQNPDQGIDDLPEEAWDAAEELLVESVEDAMRIDRLDFENHADPADFPDDFG